jgi:hypothetical protein
MTLENDHRCHLAMAYHANTLSPQQQQVCVNLIDYTVIMTKDLIKHKHKNESVPSHFTIFGRRSCHDSQPTNGAKQPHRDIAGHAATSVRDCIKDMVGHGVPIELRGTWENLILDPLYLQ